MQAKNPNSPSSTSGSQKNPQNQQHLKNQQNFIVIKFGGTSVSNRPNWLNIAGIIKRHRQKNLLPVVVCSALTGTSNALESILGKLGHDRQDQEVQAVIDSYKKLALDLGVEDTCLQADFANLQHMSLGAHLIGEVTPRLHAHVMSMGELMLTKLAHLFLMHQGLLVRWVDARQYLKSATTLDHSPLRHYLSSNCIFHPDLEMQKDFATVKVQERPVEVVLTQGFIASNHKGHTVLLGRGGSDTSAAYFAAKLQASKCEIWTDVLGMYTSNPRQIPEARLLKLLDYAEAQEIASTGAKVLHPKCIAPVQREGIPLAICCTTAPEMEGTMISRKEHSAHAAGGEGIVKSISSKTGVSLISIESVQMWQEVGFLADLFTLFKTHGISIDLLSTSESNVTVSLDTLSGGMENERIEALLAALNAQEDRKATLIPHCAAIGLVGRGIRSILPKLSPVLEVFAEQKVYMLSQAANDLNLTFVVDGDQANKIIKELHTLLFSHQQVDRLFGPMWQEEFGPKGHSAGSATSAASAAANSHMPWWQQPQQQQHLLQLAQKEKTPLYVYHQETLQESARRLKSLSSVQQVFYAIKANNHPDILRTFVQEGLGLECVSPGELQHIFKLFPQLDPQKVLFTPNFAPREEYKAALDLGVHVTVDALYPLENWPEIFSGKKLILRLDPGKGQGHHDFVKTAGEQSKFGISTEEIPQVRALAERHKMQIYGLHAHAGSGITKSEHWKSVALFLADMSSEFPDVRILNLGGGLGVPSRPEDMELSLAAVEASLKDVKNAFTQFQFWMEPGRYLVAQSGVILTKVTQLKRKGHVHYVGVDAGMNNLIRPALYGAYHPIVNLQKFGQSGSITAHVVGPICESGDTLGHSRLLSNPQEGDVLLIDTVGAYGQVMSSRYNLRGPAPEIFLATTKK